MRYIDCRAGIILAGCSRARASARGRARGNADVAAIRANARVPLTLSFKPESAKNTHVEQDPQCSINNPRRTKQIEILLSRALTSIENRLNKSCSMAIASRAASTVPKAGMSLVLLVPGIGYLETGDAEGHKRIEREGDGNQPALGAEKTRRSRAIGSNKQQVAQAPTRPPSRFLSPNTNVGRFPGPLALFSLSPSTMVLLMVMIQTAPAVGSPCCFLASNRCTWQPPHQKTRSVVGLSSLFFAATRCTWHQPHARMRQHDSLLGRWDRDVKGCVPSAQVLPGSTSSCG